MFRRRISYAKNGFQQFSGTDEEICKQIIDHCFNGTYFQTSLGHFDIFYLRDFAFCIEALLHLGYKQEVNKTLEYALHCYATSDKLTTTISKKGAPFDVFSYAVDSLPLLFHCLSTVEQYEKNRGKEFVRIYKPWLEKEITKFYGEVIDKTTGLVRVDKQFSSMKDHAQRRSSCYDNCMVAMLSECLDHFGLGNPLQNINHPKLIKKYFWTTEGFKDDLFSSISGDANVFPFWCRVIDDRNMLKQTIDAVQHAKLDQPFPLKYTTSIPKQFSFPLNMFAANYEGNSIWMHLGLCYLDVIARADKALLQKYLEEYKKRIEKHKTFVEVYTSEGSIYKTRFYVADEGMLWAAKYVQLKKRVS